MARGYIPKNSLTRGSFRALKKGMYPESDTFKEQHTPSLQGGVVDYSFNEPIMIPEIKYLWINGYTKRIGVVETTMVAIVTARDETFELLSAVAAVPDNLLISSRMELVFKMVFSIV